MLPEPSRLLITGANGHLGQRLMGALGTARGVTAVVRSSAARRAVETQVYATRSTCVELDYGDATALTIAAQGCDAAVHLVGILFICQKGRMKIAVTHMPECTDL